MDHYTPWAKPKLTTCKLVAVSANIWQGPSAPQKGGTFPHIPGIFTIQAQQPKWTRAFKIHIYLYIYIYILYIYIYILNVCIHPKNLQAPMPNCCYQNFKSAHSRMPVATSCSTYAFAATSASASMFSRLMCLVFQALAVKVQK